MVALDSGEADIDVTEGSPLFLRVVAEDLEDGPIDADSISWTSSKDGLLGSGDWVIAGALVCS